MKMKMRNKDGRKITQNEVFPAAESAVQQLRRGQRQERQSEKP